MEDLARTDLFIISSSFTILSSVFTPFAIPKELVNLIREYLNVKLFSLPFHITQNLLEFLPNMKRNRSVYFSLPIGKKFHKIRFQPGSFRSNKRIDNLALTKLFLQRERQTKVYFQEYPFSCCFKRVQQKASHQCRDRSKWIVWFYKKNFKSLPYLLLKETETGDKKPCRKSTYIV